MRVMNKNLGRKLHTTWSLQICCYVHSLHGNRSSSYTCCKQSHLFSPHSHLNSYF